MNQQPLELYDAQAVYACGMKLFHRAYAGPLLSVTRHNDDVEVNVYPDATGSITLNSPVEVIVGESGASYLGEFLCLAGYTSDPVLGVSPVVTAGVNTLYDQSSNINHLTNADTATQPLICDAGTTFSSDWGFSVSLDGGKFFNGLAFEDSVTLHYRFQLDGSTGVRYLYRQDDDAFYAKITDAYLDEAIGSSSAVVFNNESYYRDYTTYNIDLAQGSGTLLCLEVVANALVLNEPPVYRIENVGLFHSVLMYSGVNEHVRRHTTNIIMSEDLPLLAEKLERYNPQSYYNFVAGAKAVYGTFSFAGILGPLNTRMMRIRRKVGVVTQYIDLFTDNTGYITLDSPVDNPSHSTSATVLGEWVAHSAYTNTDGIAPVDIYIDRLYSQVNDSVDLIGTDPPKLYTASTETLSVAGSNGVVGLDFYVPEDVSPTKAMSLAQRFYAKTVVVVYANKDSVLETNGLVAAQYGATIYSKFAFSGFGSHGVTVYDQTNFNFTQEGIDTDVHVVSLFEDAQKVVIDNVEYDINYDKIPDGIEDTEYEDNTMWAYVGALSGSGSAPHKGYIAAVIFYDDDKYDQRDFIHDYMNTLFGVQNTPFAEPITYPEMTGFQTLEVPLAGSGNVEVAYARAPLGIEPGELLLIVGAYNTNGEVKIPYAPYGWQLYNNGNFMVSGFAGVGITLMYKIADGTEEAYPQIGVLSTAPTDEAIFWYIRIRNGSTNFFVGDGAFSNFSDVIVAPSVDTTGYTTPLALAFMATSTGSSTIINTTASDPGWSNDQGPLAWPEYNINGVSGAFAFNLVDGDSSGNASFDYLVSEEFVSGIVARQIIIPYAPAIAPLPARRTLLDEHPGAAAAYSLRLVGSNYSGAAVRVRRASDNAEQDIAFDALGSLNVGALELFCAGTDGYVVTWYDQSGNANDAVQATTSAQPKVYDSVTGNLNELLFNGIEFLSLTPISITLSVGFSLFNKRRNQFTGNYRVFIQTTGGGLDYTSGGTLVATKEFILDGDPRVVNVAAISSDLLATYIATPLSGEYYVNGVLQASDSHSKTNTINPDVARISRPSGFYGGISEMIIYASDQSANRADIETNINDYYGIYEPPRLLNNYPGAAAAYSLRKVNADYTGAAIRVRKASDNTELDIGFLATGDLNTALLSAFCDGSDGYVSIWYDQSGNANDAVQATTTAQPQIVASGSVLTQNGKPALLTDGNQIMPLTANVSFTSDFAVFSTSGADAFVRFSRNSPNTGFDFRPTKVQVYNSSTELIINHNYTTGRLRGVLRSGTDMIASIDGESITTTELNTQGLSVQFNYLFQFIFPNIKSTGYINEIITYPSDQSANRLNIEADIATYYDIYEPPKLLNTYSGAAAAYSLRQLDNTYTGAAIRVRRDTDNTELDIPFYQGDLDVATLIDFCLNANGYVSVWYDQSGNSRDAYNSTTANQFKIYDSAAGYLNGLIETAALSYLKYDFVDIPQPFSVFSAANLGPTNYPQLFDATTATSVYIGYFNNQIEMYAGLSVKGGVVSDAMHVFSGTFNTTNSELHVDGILAASGNAGTRTLRFGVIGNRYALNTAQNNTKELREFIVYPSDQSANRTDIESNINDYYDIYELAPPAQAGPPAIEAYEVSKQSTTTNPAVLTVTAPSGIQAGELLVVMTFSDVPFDGAAYNTPTGWTKIYEVGGSSPDTYGAAFYKIADGSEGASQEITYTTPTGSDNNISWYLRVSGADATNPIEAVSTVFNASFSNVVTANSVTTTNDNCLAFAVTAFDGGDGYPVSVSGTGWPTSVPAGQSDYHSDTGFSSLTAAWVSKEVLTAGTSNNVNFTYSTTDSCFALQFAIKGA